MALHPTLQIFTTGDGSPTLMFTRDDGYIEKMHHSGGALTESLYIYHHGLVTALATDLAPRVISVGLGLAYNELICLAEFMRRGIRGKIWSFEAMDYLRDEFARWTSTGLNPSEPANDFEIETFPTEREIFYDDILNFVCARIERQFAISGLRARAGTALADGELDLRASFPDDAEGIQDVGVIFYDAFSNKMSPELWQELAMQVTLGQLFAPRALICTYAQTGAMKRVLKNLGFKLEDRQGFKSKRGTTLAIRS